MRNICNNILICIVFISFFLLSTNPVLATNTIDFNIFFTQNSSGILHLLAEIQTEDVVFPTSYVIRPKTNIGAPLIFDSYTNTWVAGNEVWSKMPVLTKYIHVVIEDVDCQISFDVLDRISGKFVSTPTHNCKSNGLGEDYIRKINESLLVFSETTNEVDNSEISQTTISSQKDKLRNDPTPLYVILGVLIVYNTIKSGKITEWVKLFTDGSPP